VPVETIQAMYSSKFFDKEISFTIPDVNTHQELPTERKLSEQSPLADISGDRNKNEMIANQCNLN
jgi:hypothetical protein